MKTDTSKSLFFVKGIIVTFVFCYMILTAAAIGLQYMKHNAINPTFVLATSVFVSVFAAIVIGIPLYNLRCKE